MSKWPLAVILNIHLFSNFFVSFVRNMKIDWDWKKKRFDSSKGYCLLLTTASIFMFLLMNLTLLWLFILCLLFLLITWRVYFICWKSTGKRRYDWSKKYSVFLWGIRNLNRMGTNPAVVSTVRRHLSNLKKGGA